MSTRLDRHEKFKQLATARVAKAAKALQLVGNLGNRSNYTYTQDDVRKIFSYLDKAMKDARRKFEVGAGEGADGGFRL